VHLSQDDHAAVAMVIRTRPLRPEALCYISVFYPLRFTYIDDLFDPSGVNGKLLLREPVPKPDCILALRLICSHQCTWAACIIPVCVRFPWVIQQCLQYPDCIGSACVCWQAGVM
jgi:hypothetical protein